MVPDSPKPTNSYHYSHIFCIDRMREKYNLDYKKNLFYSYYIKREKPEISCYVLNARPRANLLILDFSLNEHP